MQLKLITTNLRLAAVSIFSGMRLCTDRIGLVIYGRRSSIGVGGYKEGEKEDEKERKMMGMGGGVVKVYLLVYLLVC